MTPTVLSPGMLFSDGSVLTSCRPSQSIALRLQIDNIKTLSIKTAIASRSFGNKRFLLTVANLNGAKPWIYFATRRDDMVLLPGKVGIIPREELTIPFLESVGTRRVPTRSSRVKAFPRWRNVTRLRRRMPQDGLWPRAISNQAQRPWDLSTDLDHSALM